MVFEHLVEPRTHALRRLLGDRVGVGTELLVVGRVRRRFFQGNGLQSRTEVVVDHAAPARQTVRSAAVVKRALSVIGGLADSPDDDGSGC